jgi:protocatechuate 3,4-dioxygenase beta subunit
MSYQSTESPDLFDLGLAADVTMLSQSPIARRRILKLGVAGIALLLTGCAQSSTTSSSSTAVADAGAATTTTTDDTGGACVDAIPQETAGPYPADGSNASNQQLNAMALSGIVRNDVRTSLGTGNVAEGIPLTVEMTLVDTSADCAPLAGYAVYMWHCTREGEYSMYSSALTDEDYLRGVQASDSNGKVSFTTVFPGCYAGRWPHIHFEVYPALEQATDSSNAVQTSQLAMPEAACTTAYAADGYTSSVQNLAEITLESDNVFGDGVSLQMATVTGDVTSGYTAQLTVGV